MKIFITKVVHVGQWFWTKIILKKIKDNLCLMTLNISSGEKRRRNNYLPNSKTSIEPIDPHW